MSIGAGPAQWVAYAILFILGLIYLAFLLMLLVKILEAVLRVIGGIGFTRSRHVVDSGLLGTMGLMGCCGPRQARHSRSGYRPAHNRQPSSLALSRPAPPFKDSTPPSSGPPSVLRPEHAMQPYKEDSDDETGFIMAAWQPFPAPAEQQQQQQQHPPAAPAPTPKSGFARVGGGRAHYDSPYAIASGSTQTFPSVERPRGPSSLANPSVAEDSPPPTPSVASAARGLPPGAMPPAHVRTKSQTAIIENAPPLAAASAAAAVAAAAAGGASNGDAIGPPDRRHVRAETMVEGGGAGEQPKKKHWYNRKKNRRMSDSDVAAAPASPPPQETGRSFVVVRKPRPGASAAGSAQGSSTSASAHMGGAADELGRRSFTVLRGPAHSDPAAPPR